LDYIFAKLPAGLAPLALTAATTSATAATPESAGATSRTATIHLGPCFVYVQRAPSQVVAVQARNCAVSFRRVRHFDEGEASRTTRVAIGHQVHAFHSAIRFEKGADRLFRCAEIQVANENILHRISLQFESGYDEAEWISARLSRTIKCIP
jgi:hypothetical protein